MSFSPRTFRCPNCDEMINDSMKECRYCSVRVDPLLIRWQVKFGGLVTSDLDYQTARRSWTTSLIMLIVAAPLGFIVRPIVQLLLLRLTGDL